MVLVSASLVTVPRLSNVILPEEALSLKPSTLSLAQAAAIGVPFLTAWFALVRAAQLEPGETILIVGVGGAVGQAAMQIANWRKSRVLGAARSSDPIPGAVAVINTGTNDLRKRVFELTEGKGVDVVLDAVGGPMFERALGCLRIDGRQVAITSTGDRRVSFDLVDFYHNESRLIGVDSMKFSPHDVSVIADELRQGFEANILKVPACGRGTVRKCRRSLRTSRQRYRAERSRCSPFPSLIVQSPPATRNPGKYSFVLMFCLQISHSAFPVGRRTLCPRFLLRMTSGHCFAISIFRI